MTNKTLPQSIETERALICACLIDNSVISEIADIIKPDDFYSVKHQLIFKKMTKMVDGQTPVDLITLNDALSADSRWKKCGGSAAYAAEIIDEVPAAVNARHYARIVREKSLIRKTLQAGNDIVNAAWEASDSAALLGMAEEKIMAVQGSRVSTAARLGDLLDDHIDALEERAKSSGTLTGIPTGFNDLDRLTCGLQPTDLIVLAGRPSMGKSALAWAIVAAGASKGHPWGVFTMEMSEDQFVGRGLSAVAMVRANYIRRGSFHREDWERIMEAYRKMSDWPIWIDDCAGIGAMELRAKARRMKRDHGIQGIMIDYLQLMTGDGRSERRELEVADISRQMKAMAKELNIPVLALSQLNRKLEDRADKRPLLSDLRESGALEQDADVVMFIYRDEVHNKDENNPNRGKAELLIEKQRNGPTGMVPLAFFKEFVLFQSLSDYKV